MLRPFSLALILCSVLALTGCTSRATVLPKPAPENIGTDVAVLVGTTRARNEDGAYAPQQRGDVSFASIVVSIPPQHEDGKVEVGGSKPDPEKHFLTRSIQPLGSTEFRAEVARRFASNPDYRGEAFIFVHGFNNTFGDSVFRTAQIASDLGINALPVSYSWPSAGKPLGYPYDRDSAIYARRGLEALIEELTAAGAKSVILMAHSMGSEVTMEALRRMSLAGRGAAWDRIGGVALFAPDIDIDVFHSQVADIGTLPKPFLVFVSKRDAALRLSARMTGQKERLGNISSIEDVGALDITVLDVSNFRDTRNVHMTALSSPTLIALASQTDTMERAFQRENVARLGLLPGTILTVQNATEIILDPAGAAQALE